jgi:hypothetical protein
VTIKARVLEKKFSFREASASFQAERFFGFWLSYRSADDLAYKRLFRPITVFIVRLLVYFISLSFVSSAAARLPFLFYLAFFWGNKVRPEGTVPPIGGGVEE